MRKVLFIATASAITIPLVVLLWAGQKDDPSKGWTRHFALLSSERVETSATDAGQPSAGSTCDIPEWQLLCAAAMAHPAMDNSQSQFKDRLIALEPELLQFVRIPQDKVLYQQLSLAEAVQLNPEDLSPAEREQWAKFLDDRLYRVQAQSESELLALQMQWAAALLSSRTRDEYLQNLLALNQRWMGTAASSELQAE